MLLRKLLLFGATFLGISIFVALSFSQSPEKKPDGAKAAGEPVAGKVIYEKRCAICHLASSDKTKVGPGLKGLGKRHTFASGKPVTNESLRTWIENGGGNMPAFKGVLNAEQLRDLMAYLKTL
jgi:mono/diheme cytochrome c family protein